MIENLEKMEVMVLDGNTPTGFWVNSNTIHACLSLTESCHTGLNVRSRRFLPDADELITWALDWMEGEGADSGLHEMDAEDVQRLLGEVEETIYIWGRCRHSEVEVKFQGWKGRVKEIVKKRKSGYKSVAVTLQRQTDKIMKNANKRV